MASLQALTGMPLAQQIAQLDNVAPVDFDPEDVQVTGIDSDIDLAAVADINAARAHYFDVGPSSLRKLHDSLADPKYGGAQTSRRQVLDDSSGNNSDSGSVSEDGESNEARTPGQTGVNREVDMRTTTDASTKRQDVSKQNDLSSGLRKTREEDHQKGKAISRQIASVISPALSGTRFLMPAFAFKNQSRLEIASLLRPPQLTADERVHNSLVSMLEEARLLSNEIFDFQECLLSANESIQPPPRKRQRSTESDYSVTDYAEELREASRAASMLESTYHLHLVQTLNKWSSKIQAVAPSVLLPSNRNAFSRMPHHNKSAPQLIDETLADRGKVLARTRIYRGKGSRLGTSAMDEDDTQTKDDPEVFDDTDFYHQLLRDIIDARGHGGNDDWIAVQKEKRAKKKVDTKASKGRKLRYEVHEKLQNFMVPVLTQGSWHEEQIDQLFSSLLGKGFESAMQEAGETVGEPLQMQLGGFRVFG